MGRRPRGSRNRRACCSSVARFLAAAARACGYSPYCSAWYSSAVMHRPSCTRYRATDGSDVAKVLETTVSTPMPLDSASSSRRVTARRASC